MDSALPGFGLRVAPNGTKTYFIRYRANGGGRNAPQRYMSIGRHGALTAEEARKKAKKLLGSVAKGDDPVEDRTALRREMTVAELIQLYERDGCFVQRGIRQGQAMKAATKAFTLARLRHHVLPTLGLRRVSEVSPADIERLASHVSNGGTACETHTPAVAGRRPQRVVDFH
jgi:hypothetical protein